MPACRAAQFVPAVVLLALSVGCSAKNPSTAASSGSPLPTVAATPSAEPASPPAAAPSPPVEREPSAAAPPVPSATGPSTGEPSGAPLTVTAVRVARQEGFDRVVLELAGEQDGVPGWRVAYEEDPRRDGSGDPVQVDGAAVLVVRVLGAGYPFDTGQTEVTSVSVPGDTVVVQDVELGSVFEGTYEAFVGVREQAPFTVTRLSGPARVVIDVQHP